MIFGEAAGRLAGQTGALLGWSPDEFWNATPAELGAIVTALAAQPEGADSNQLRELMELFPDAPTGGQ